MKKKPLQVTLHVREPSVVELTVGDKVQVDRLTPSPRGYLAERHGALLSPGVATLNLEQGFYFFKTLSDASLKVVQGGVDATESGTGGKDLPPPPAAAPSPERRGDEVLGEEPNFILV